MAQEIHSLAEFKDAQGQSFRRRVIVSLDRVPFDLKHRNDLIDQALTDGRYRVAPPTIGETTLSAGQSLGQAALEYGPSMAAIGMGATRGAAALAPAGPLPAFLGGIGGAILGGVTGRAATETGKTMLGQPAMSIPEQVASGAEAGLKAEAYGLPFRGLGALTGTMRIPGAVPGATAPLTVLRQQTVQAAKKLGIDLTAAEQSGSPLLRLGEVITERSVTGMSPMQAFKIRQAQQVLDVGESVGVQWGPAMDVGTRSNRFLAALEGRVEQMKQMASGLFDRYVTAAGSRSPAPLQPLFDRAFEIRGDLPLFQSLKNPKLTNPSGTGLLDEIQTLQQQGFTTLPLEELRKLKTAVGNIAYPSRFQGTVVVDAPVAAARRLYGSLQESVKQNAAATGTTALLEEANQFESRVIHGVLDGRFYTQVVKSEKSLGTLGKTLFNPRDPGMLLDAKTAVSPEGWKILQQHYWDETFSPAITVNEAGVRGFQGAKFADKVASDRSILNILYDPEQVRRIQEFASVARLASRSSRLAEGDMMGILVGGGQIYMATRGIQNLVEGDVPEAAFDLATLLAPYFAAKVLTNPTTAQMLTRMIQTGNTSAAAVAQLGKTLAILEGVRESQPTTVTPSPSVSITTMPPLPTPSTPSTPAPIP